MMDVIDNTEFIEERIWQLTGRLVVFIFGVGISAIYKSSAWGVLIGIAIAVPALFSFGMILVYLGIPARFEGVGDIEDVEDVEDTAFSLPTPQTVVKAESDREKAVKRLALGVNWEKLLAYLQYTQNPKLTQTVMCPEYMTLSLYSNRDGIAITFPELMVELRAANKINVGGKTNFQWRENAYDRVLAFVNRLPL